MMDEKKDTYTYRNLDKLDYSPALEAPEERSREEERAYHKALRKYFLTGQKTPQSPDETVAPVLLAPYLRGVSFDNTFPVICDTQSNVIEDWTSYVMNKYIFFSDDQDRETFRAHLSSFVVFGGSLDNNERIDKDAPEFHRLLVEHIMTFEAPVEMTASFKKNVDRFYSDLKAGKAVMIDFSARTPFHILNLQLAKDKETRKGFIKRLRKCLAGVNDILGLHDKQDNAPGKHYDFAKSLISFDSIEGVAPRTMSTNLPEERLEGLRKAKVVLDKSYNIYSQSSHLILIHADMASKWGMESILDNAKIELLSDCPMTMIRARYQEELENFIELMAAMKRAELEMDQKYDEHLHKPYFEHFNINYIAPEDLRQFRSMIVLDESQHMLRESQVLLNLLSDGAMIKFIGVNLLHQLTTLADRSSSDETYLELASLAIFRRNAYVFQGAADTPVQLSRAFATGLTASTPVVWNILVPDPGSQSATLDLMKVNLAIESRYFPRLEYNIETGEDFGMHLDVTGNPQHKFSLPTFKQETKTSAGEESHQYKLTPVDFLLLSNGIGGSLEIAPNGFADDQLIEISKYLTSPEDNHTGKLPFAWVVDDADTLKKVVIPLRWLQSTRNRLDYWHFIQEVGGVKSAHLQRTLAAKKEEWDTAKESEITQLKEDLNQAFESTRQDDIYRAIVNILNAMLGSEDPLALIQREADRKDEAEVEAEVEVESADNGGIPTRSHLRRGAKGEAEVEVEVEVEAEVESLRAEVPSEVWVESDECTSCNDCIEALPGVFKYNDDKQAYVHNPKGGPYAKIVAVAEKCPAMCIHPGLPDDPKAPGMDKLIQRAEKFN